MLNYHNATGGKNQLWWDDPLTLAKKYAKVKAAGLRGLGMWTADSAGSDASTAESMWDAVPAPKKKREGDDGEG